MPYPNVHILLKVGGHFGTSSSPLENWSVGMRLGVVGADVPHDAAKLDALVASALTAFNAFQSNASAQVGSSCFLSWGTAATVGTDGRYNPPAQVTVRKDQAPVAGGGTTSMPWTTALVTSLRTAVPRGPGSNGRIYWPYTAGGMDSANGLAFASNVLGRLNAMKTALQAVNAAAATYQVNTRLVVASAVGAGALVPVTSIRSDNRFDSIERRENQLKAVYQSVAL